MGSKNIEFNIEVDIVSLDPELIDEHLRYSTAVLHEMLSSNSDRIEHSGFLCQHCGKSYKTPVSLNLHYLFKHPQDKIKAKCTICNKRYPSLMSLQKHIRYMHRYNHRCKACYRTFATAEQLCDHELRCSKKETPCQECGKIFKSTLALRNHRKYKHPTCMNNICEICRRSFTSLRSLSNHVANVHRWAAENVD